MVTEAKPIITLEELECYLPNRVRRSGKEYRTGTDGSRSGTNLAINLEKQVYYDFHYNQGGSLITLLRHLGAPISQDTARASPLLSYRYQVAILAHTKSEGRYGGCGKRTAVKQSQETGSYLEAHRIMCLQWNCPRCAPLLKEMWLI